MTEIQLSSPPVRDPMSELNVERVIWIRVGALGDLLVSLKALETSLARFSNAQFWVLGSRQWIEILRPELWPRVDGILVSESGKIADFFEVKNEHWMISARSVPLSDYFRRADATINLRIESLRFAWGPFKSMVPIRIGSCQSAFKWAYTHHYPWLGKEPAIHERDWYDQVARANGEARPTSESPKLVPLERTGLPALLPPPNEETFQIKWGLGWKKFVLINPTASRVEKAWPQSKFRELVQVLSKKLVPLIVVGAPYESEWLKFVAQDVRVIQPKMLQDLFELVSGAKLLVCNTSSMQFVAASQSTTCIVLMGLTSPQRWGPLGPQDVVVKSSPLTLNNLSKGDLFEAEREAYEQISVESVLNEIEALTTPF